MIADKMITGNRFFYLISAIIVLFFLSFVVLNSPPSGDGGFVSIEQGYSSSKIAILLKENNLIKSSLFFKILCKISGATRRLQSGYYFFKSGSLGIVKKLKRGVVYTRSVTIPEGFTIYQIAELLDKKEIITKSEFLKLVRNRDILNRYSINSPTAEGYLFPDTYFFKKGISGEEIVEAMTRKFFLNINDRYLKKMRDLNLTLKQLLILSSIVELEAKAGHERPIIASIFLRRFRAGKKLESCSTILYALGRHKNKLYYRDLKVDSPYNTYIYSGLPPTPVCNPGDASLMAVLFPAKVDYLYFVSRNDGTHYFTKSYRKHMEAYRKYQKNGVFQ